MRLSLISSLVLPPLALAQTVNITKTEDVDLASKTGELGWGADSLAFGYSAGAGLNFSSVVDFVGGGFNAGVPGLSEGALGGGWTLTHSTVEFGLGGVFNNQSFNIAVSGDKKTGQLMATVNSKTVAL
ncbi:hypothetical protein KVR01_002367 [Diaporthe batatas]|uniref:uncharacterized protein n=1 Tax=Diaporthe batatas TaxID=748121 RepID=UPI001D041EA0|nr:uncharacterized protein KVR01_002367 [Diaporthe batatas]KAG8166678.1 hypothetical protein KVR01_002367 [Diaporthe batatas]